MYFMISLGKLNYILPKKLQLLAACCLVRFCPVLCNNYCQDRQKRMVLPLALPQISSWQHGTEERPAHEAWCGRGFL